MIEWDVPARLETDIGDLFFNEPTASTSNTGFFVLMEDRCKATRSLRTVVDKIPQGDGEIFHRRFRDGTEFQLAVQLWEDEHQHACGQQKREMYEELVAHLDAILNGGGRFIWQPTGYGDERMLETCRWLTPIDPSYEQGVLTLTFTIDSPFPYVIDKTQREDSPGAGGILVPAGTPTSIVLPTFSAPFWPVMQAYPDDNTWTIVNSSVEDEYGDALEIVYDGNRPPAAGTIANPHYAEIDTFRETIYYDGNMANLKPYIDAEQTDYFYLQSGSNLIIATDVDVLFLINNAWAVG